MLGELKDFMKNNKIDTVRYAGEIAMLVGGVLTGGLGYAASAVSVASLALHTYDVRVIQARIKESEERLLDLANIRNYEDFQEFLNS